MRDGIQQLPAEDKQTALMKRAAAYVRMSTEHQKYSTANQLRTIGEYAANNDLSIVEVYSDEGISGLHIKKRFGLQRLLNDVVRGNAKFDTILVYDISRWGRFQDPDQSAHYEYLCRMSGVDVVYCAELFQGDRSPMAAVYKSIRRIEAADFSRDLSVRIFKASCHLASRGHSLGGRPRYGLRHVLVGDDGKPVKKLVPRSTRLAGYHAVLAPGPPKEVRVVQLIFRRYVKVGDTPPQIARFLNSGGYRTRSGHLWNSARVREMLSEEKYVGTMVYARKSYKMHGKTKSNPQSEWIRKANAFPAIIDPATFKAAQDRRKKEPWRRTDKELLEMLRRFLARHGYITEEAMLKFGGVPAPTRYQYRFGSMVNAYNLIGYEWASKNPHWKETIRRRRLRARLLDELSQITSEMGSGIRVNAWQSRFWIGDISCYFRINSKRGLKHRYPIWMAYFKEFPAADFCLFGRLDTDRETVMDYYLVPQAAVPAMPWGLKIRNGSKVDAYRARDLRAVAKRLVDASARARPVRGIMMSHMAH